MIDLDQLDELARRLSSLVPPAMREGREELQQNFKAVLQNGLGKLDLVTREEFEVQRAVLLRTREKLDALQRAVAEFEAQLGNASPTGMSPGSGSDSAPSDSSSTPRH
jgi:BMFP domain-containing protein YqiC